MTQSDIVLCSKLLAGIDLSSKLLIENKQRSDEDLFLWVDGEIVKVKARNIESNFQINR